jgi:Xaa-Pro dipeptidase
MISRRRFVQLGTLASGALTASSVAHASADESPSQLPPSIAALKSMKDLAKPITTAERRERQEKARRLMEANHIDALLLMEGTSLNYFTGIQWQGGERLFAMVLPAKGAAFYVCPAFEEGRAREQTAQAPDGEHADVRTWQEDESPYQRLVQGLKDRGIAKGTIGLEETIRFVFSDSLAKTASHAKLVSGTPVTAGCRMIKSSHELELMRLANRVTLTAYEAAYRALKDGMTQSELEQLIGAAYLQLGFPGEASVQLNEFSALPHGSVTPQVIREGSLVMIDDGCDVEGYQSDITRTFVLGKPSDKMKKVFDIVHQAQAAALRAARPGAECQAVDTAARSVVTGAGYGLNARIYSRKIGRGKQEITDAPKWPDYKFFTHRVGHGIGMDGHEWPYLVSGNTTALASGMTFSDEPGIYIPGEFGMRLEDDMYITENGAELFTPQSL